MIKRIRERKTGNDRKIEEINKSEEQTCKYRCDQEYYEGEVQPHPQVLGKGLTVWLFWITCTSSIAREVWGLGLHQEIRQYERSGFVLLETNLKLEVVTLRNHPFLKMPILLSHAAQHEKHLVRNQFSMKMGLHSLRWAHTGQWRLNKPLPLSLPLSGVPFTCHHGGSYNWIQGDQTLSRWNLHPMGFAMV